MSESLSAAERVAWLPADRRLVVIQRNPTSGSGRVSRQLRVLIHELRAAGMAVRLFASRDRFDRFVRSSAVADSLRCLVAAGGDGTVSGLAHRHSDLPIATLPMGTENLVARHLRMPACGATVAQRIVDGAIRKFDTALINGQRFLLMASVGVDADVVRRVHAVRHGNIRHWTYVKPIVQSFLGYEYPSLSVHASDGALLGEGSHVIVTNMPEYGFRIPFCPLANPHDGLLDVRIFHQTGRLATIPHALRTRLGFADRRAEVTRLLVSEAEIRSSLPATASQCDGDPAPNCPVRISIDPASLTLIVAAR
ncbi:MAG: diacylglycerol kinase family protein [Planctomycetaceae bacterium]